MIFNRKYIKSIFFIPMFGRRKEDVGHSMSQHIKIQEMESFSVFLEDVVQNHFDIKFFFLLHINEFGQHLIETFT